MGGLTLLAVVSVLTGLAILRIARALAAPSDEDAQVKDRVEAARPFGGAATGDPILVEGLVVEGRDGALEAPISRHKCVYVDLVATEEQSTQADDGWKELFHERAARSFSLSLADRRCVPVRLSSRATIRGVEQTASGPVVKPSAALQGFLDAQRRPLVDPAEFVRRRDYRESVLRVGAKVVALGVLKEPDTESRRGAGYRVHEGGAFVELDLVDASADAAALVRRGSAERLGIGGWLGPTFIGLGPALALLAGLAGLAPRLSVALWGLFAIPFCAGLAWVGLWFVSEVLS